MMLPTQNEDWGFYGTAKLEGGEAFAKEAWMRAFEHVNAWMNWGDEMTRDFLDSREGRKYADIMHGKVDWMKALTHDCNLEFMCRSFWEETDLRGYRRWCSTNGTNPTERTLVYGGFNKVELRTVVNNLLGLDYSQAMINDALTKAGPIAQALIIILKDIPEEILEMYLNAGAESNDDSNGMSPG